MRARGLTSALWASIDARARDGGAEGDAFDAVSYTHLTLPTKA